MPCDGEREVQVILDSSRITPALKGKDWTWDDSQLPTSIITGWRYAGEKKPKQPLGPEDVPPGSVFRLHDADIGYEVPCEVSQEGVTFADDTGNFAKTWEELRHWQINRSIPMTGKWNPSAWEPCEK